MNYQGGTHCQEALFGSSEVNYQGGTRNPLDYVSVGWFHLQARRSTPDRPLQDCKSFENVPKTAQIAPESAREIGSRVRGCAETARWVARDPAARKAAQVKVRSKCYAKKVETMNSSKLALAEELATLSGCEPFYPRSEATLLTVAGALDSAG